MEAKIIQAIFCYLRIKTVLKQRNTVSMPACRSFSTGRNGRCYDPKVGRFLSADNFVQSPGNTQSYNRYSYCLNNPLIYTDPTGQTWWSHFTGWVGEKLDNPKVVIPALLFCQVIPSGILETTAATQFGIHAGNAALNWFGGVLDGGLAEGDRRAQNSWKIAGGLYKADDEYGGSDWNEVWQVVSRFTWQEPTTTLGYVMAQGYNLFGQVDVEYFNGATVLYDHDFGSGGAFSFGGFIFMDRYEYGWVTDAWGNTFWGQTTTLNTNGFSNSMLVHEYGHFAQTRDWGGLLTHASSFSSLMDATFNGDIVHDKLWIERDANARALAYFSGRQGFEVGTQNYNDFITSCGAGNIQFYDNRFFKWWYPFFPDPIFNTYYHVNNNPR